MSEKKKRVMQMFPSPEFFPDNKNQALNFIEPGLFHPVFSDPTLRCNEMNFRFISLLPHLFAPATISASVKDRDLLSMRKGIIETIRIDPTGDTMLNHPGTSSHQMLSGLRREFSGTGYPGAGDQCDTVIVMHKKS
jgi:hypothetical protein